MRLKVALLTCLTLACASVTNAQQRKVTFNVSPRNAILIFDEDTLGIADEQKVVMGFNERKGIVGHTVYITADGYDRVSLEYDVDVQDEKIENVSLRRSLPKLSLPEGFSFQFDKVISGIEYATQVGNNTRWKYRYNEEVVIADRRLQIVQAMQEIGLHSNDNLEANGANVLISGMVTSLELKRGTEEDGFSPYSSKVTSTTTISWRFYDTNRDVLIMEVPATSVYAFNAALLNDEFYNAIVENFLVLFSLNKALGNDLIEFTDERIELLASEKKAAEEALIREEEARLAAERKAMADSLYAIGLGGDTSLISLQDSAEEVMIGEALLIDHIDLPGEYSALQMQDKMRAATVTIIEGKAYSGGVAVSTNGYIVCTFLPQNTAELTVQFYNGIVLPATVLKSSQKHNLSLLKVDANNLQALPLHSEPTGIRKEQVVLLSEPAPPRSLNGRIVQGTLVQKELRAGVKYLRSNVSVTEAVPGSPLFTPGGEMLGLVTDFEQEACIAVNAGYLYTVFGLHYE